MRDDAMIWAWQRIKNNRRDNPSLGGIPFQVSCAIEIENREDLWYNKISINRTRKRLKRNIWNWKDEVYYAEANNVVPGWKKKKILEIVEKEGRITVSDIQQIFLVGYETAKKDLALLESDNKLKRVYGGAISLSCNND